MPDANPPSRCPLGALTRFWQRRRRPGSAGQYTRTDKLPGRSILQSRIVSGSAHQADPRSVRRERRIRDSNSPANGAFREQRSALGSAPCELFRAQSPMLESDLSGFVPSRMYGFVRGRQLEGTYPGSPADGVWISTAMRVFKGWGAPDEALWPYDGDAKNWPPTEPEGIDAHAKAHRIFAYQRVSSVDECRIAIASNGPVLAGFEIDNSWAAPPKGVIPASTQEVTSAHTVSLDGYDDNRKWFKFWNSWGPAWGEGGYGYLPYSYFEDRFLEGWTFLPPAPVPPPGRRDGIYLRMWGIPDLFGRMLHSAELVDEKDDEIVGWGFAIVFRDLLLLEELFVRPNWRLCGHGSQLADVFTQLAARIGVDLRAWIPRPDAAEENRSALEAILRHLGLARTRSPVRWAAAAETLI